MSGASRAESQPHAADALSHRSILASAGSGKTHQLASRYLRLLWMGADPSSILASTFTRAAAGEIRDRVLSWLAAAVDDEQKREELRVAIAAPALAPEDVVTMLRRLTRRLHRLQIRTLDSFFAAIVRTFAIELQVPIAAQLVEDDRAQALRSEAIRLMLDERQPQALIDLLRRLTRGASERGVTETIDRAVADAFELFREAPFAAWEHVPRMPGELERSELARCIEEFSTCCVLGNAKTVEAHAKSIEAARRHDWEALLKNGMGRPLSRGESTYNKKPIEPHVIDAYMPVVRHAVATVVTRWRGQTLATRDLLALYGEHYETVRSHENAMTFADLTASIASAESLGALEDICYRLDATVHHLLLDEFQDTSILQWRALEPVAREIVSHAPPDRTLFSVGDVKQSIYRWRHAAPEILDELPDLLVGPDGGRAIEESTLAENWRSSPVVIETVNDVFGALENNRALSEFRDAAAKWNTGFERHRAVEKKSELSGRAELRTVTLAPNGAKPEVHRLQQAARLARELHDKSPWRSIMILTRTNRAVARLLYELGPSRLNIGASGRGGGPLTDAPAVNAVLDLLQLADHPSDTAAAFHVAGSPLGRIVDLGHHDSAHERRRVARSVRQSIATRGYAALCAELVSSLAPSCDAREQRRLIQLVELAARFDQRGRGRAADFIRMVETIAVADAEPAAIEVMTVHQAKGLEADIVILPDLEWRLAESGSPSLVFERVGQTGPITRICRYANETVRAFAPELEPLFDRHKSQTVRESLSVLYVAMTRAKQGLFMLIDPPKENECKWPKTAAGLLRSALAPVNVEPGTTVHARGDDGWLSGGDDPQDRETPDDAPPAARPGTITLSARAPGVARTALRRSAASASEAEFDRFQVLRLPADEAREFGTALHVMCEQIEWLEEWTPDRDALTAIARRVSPRRGPDWASHCVDRFMQMMTLPGSRSIFNRGDRDADAVRVWRELPFARFVDGSLRTGVIDRLEAEFERGQAVRGTVIDFKTDDVEPDGVAAAAESYREQLRAYRAAAAEWLGIDELQIRTILVFLACDQALELPS